MGLSDYKLVCVPQRDKIIAACSDKPAEQLVEQVKVLSDAEPGFDKAFNNFLKAGPEKRKQIYTADKLKSETWANDIVDHQDVISSNNANVQAAQAEKIRLTTDHEATVARLTSEYQQKMAIQNTAIARWNQDSQQQAKDIQNKSVAKALLAPSLKIMESITTNPHFFVAARSDIETAQKLLSLNTEASVKEAVDAPQPDGEDSSGTKILITLAALGVNMHEIHGEDGIDINPKLVRRLGRDGKVRLICECLCIGNAVGGLFSLDIEKQIRRDQSQDRKRTLEVDPDLPLNKFNKRLKKASDNSPYKDRIDDEATSTKLDDSQE